MSSPTLPQDNIQQEVAKPLPFVFNQRSFAGGLNQQVDPTRLLPDEYPLAVNIRTRFGVVEPVYLPTTADVQGTLVGLKIQGIYSAGPFLIVFASGGAYYRNSSMTNSAFTKIGGFNLDAGVNNIYAEQVPSSSMNYQRLLTDATDNTAGVKLFSSVGGSPQCVICQDGLNQPWLIFEDGTARQANTYDQWTIDDREYVPIGTIMLYSSGVLYIVGDVKTGSAILKNRQIFRSVTGRPLDFVVNIDINGDKGGEAFTTSFSVDFDEITCLGPLNSNTGAFKVNSVKNTYLTTPVTSGVSLPFNEPVFTHQWLFNSGTINNFSDCDKTGDVAFIGQGGIRSFNAVLQNRNEGKNLPFSKKISLLFEGITQTITAAKDYDDYCFFSVDTKYGRAILVYDTIQDCWVGLDIPDNFTPTEAIVQFCEVKEGATRKLFCRTTENKIYSLFDGTKVARATLYLGEWCSNDCGYEQMPEMLKLVFTDVETTGDVSVKLFVDSKGYAPQSLRLVKTVDAVVPPLAIPFGAGTADVVRNINFTSNADTGWKVGVLISWNFAAQLSHVRLESDKIEAKESTDEQAASLYSS